MRALFLLAALLAAALTPSPGDALSIGATPSPGDALSIGAKPSGRYWGSIYLNIKGEYYTVWAELEIIDDTHFNIVVEGFYRPFDDGVWGHGVDIKCKNEEYEYLGDTTVILPNIDDRRNCINNAMKNNVTLTGIKYIPNADIMQPSGFFKITVNIPDKYIPYPYVDAYVDIRLLPYATQFSSFPRERLTPSPGDALSIGATPSPGDALSIGAKPRGNYWGFIEVPSLLEDQNIYAWITVIDDTHFDIYMRGIIDYRQVYVDCKNEEYEYLGDTTVILPNIDDPTNCINDAMRKHRGLTGIKYNPNADTLVITFDVPVMNVWGHVAMVLVPDPTVPTFTSNKSGGRSSFLRGSR